jgi:hypothetical protein
MVGTVGADRTISEITRSVQQDFIGIRLSHSKVFEPATCSITAGLAMTAACSCRASFPSPVLRTSIIVLEPGTRHTMLFVPLGLIGQFRHRQRHRAS